MLSSLEQAVGRRWGQQDELLASIFDVLHHLYIAFLTANTAEKDRHRLPKPLRYPRPNEARPRKKTWMELALEMTGRRR